MKYINHVRQNQVYSGIENLPKGTAPDTIIEGCAVLEGGAFRGVYGEGVLDAMMEQGLNLSCTIGVSAGALNGLNYVAGNIGRAARTNLRFRHDDRYVGLTALRNNHGLIGFDFAFHELNRYEPLNLERLRDPRRRFVAVATDCRTGKPLYFEKGKCEDIFKAMQASASMPYFSQMVVVEGRECLDGGCSRCIPYEWALEQGYEKIVVVRTREEAYRATHTPTGVARKLYRDYPNLVDNLRESDIEYNRECDELAKLKEAGRIFMICPSEPPAVGRIEKDMEKLGELYYLGYNDAMRCMDALKAYLGTARRCRSRLPAPSRWGSQPRCRSRRRQEAARAHRRARRGYRGKRRSG